MKARPKIVLQRRLPVVWLIVLLITAVILPGRIWDVLLVGVGGLVLVGYVWVWQLSKGLGGRRQLRFGWVSVGDRLSEQFEIWNNSPLPALWVEVADESNVPGYRAAVVRSVGAQNQERWRRSAVCQQRGQFRLGPWSLHSSDPFGIFGLTIPYPKGDEIVIHPPVHTGIPVPLPAGRESGQARTRVRGWQATINAAAVRDYLPNDPLHWIHWPTTAHRDELFVRRFDLDTAGDLWLVLDLEEAIQLGQGADGTEEHTVLLAAALADQARRQNRAVGLAGYGRVPQLIPPGRGQGQQWKLLRALALVTADGDSDLAAALRDVGQLARRGSAAVIITPSGRPDWLSHLLQLAQGGIGSHVILLDRPSFGGQGSSQGLRDALGQLGISGTVIRQGEVGRPVEEQVRRGFWEFKVTATGRVIVTRRPDAA